MIGRDKPVTRFVEVKAGARIAYCEFGDPGGRPVFYFHGTPGSRYEPSFQGHDEALKSGYRIIAPDRPGLGRSDYIVDRTLLDWPRMVRAMAEQLGLASFGIIGASGGGAYALACAFAIAEALDFVAVMGSWGPVAEEPRLWEMMAPLDRFFGRLSRGAAWAFCLPFSLLGLAARWLSPQGFAKSLASSLSEDDKRRLEDEALARFFAADIKEAFRSGVRGPAGDALLLYRDWGFKVGEIGMGVHLFHGQEDKFAPYSFAEYLKGAISGSELHTYPDMGHLGLFSIFDDVFNVVSRNLDPLPAPLRPG